MNLKELAVELGVSVTTVSRALNGFPEVSQSTRERVLAAAERHHYRPNASARRLALGRSDAIGLVLPTPSRGFDDAGLLAVITALNEALAEQGVDLLILLSTEHDALGAYERTVAARRVDAFVVVRTQVRDERLALLRQREVPFVAYGRSAMLRSPYAWLDFDHEWGGVQAARCLLAQGHEQVGYIGEAPIYDFAARRFGAFARTLATAGHALADRAVQRDVADAASGYAAMQSLLALPGRPSAVFVDNGPAGAGAVQAAVEADLKAGRDLTLLVYGGLRADVGDAGAGGLHVSAFAAPDPQPGNTGRRLAEMTLDLLAGKPLESLQCLRTPCL